MVTVTRLVALFCKAPSNQDLQTHIRLPTIAFAQFDAQDAGNLDGVQLSYLHRVVREWAGMVAHWPKQRRGTEGAISPG